MHEARLNIAIEFLQQCWRLCLDLMIIKLFIPQDCFILDCGKPGIFAWIGKKCSAAEKAHSMKQAEQFLKQNGYPAYTRVILINITYLWNKAHIILSRILS